MTTLVATVPPRPTDAYSRTIAEELVRCKFALLVSGALLVLLYANSFAKLWSDWGEDENYSHGYIVPIVFGWIIWRKREQLGRTVADGRWWGVLIIALGIVQLLAGKLGAENFVTNSSLLVVLCGSTLFLFGAAAVRQLAFPTAWLLFMVPLPAIVFYSITIPLQLLASSLASRILDVLSVANVREGNVIYLANYSMGVVDACSGIRSVISLLAVAVLLAYVTSLKVWARAIIVFAAVPIALFVNVLRITGTGLVGNFCDRRYTEGFFHAFSGWMLFLSALLFLVAVTFVMKRVAAPNDGTL